MDVSRWCIDLLHDTSAIVVFDIKTNQTHVVLKPYFMQQLHNKNIEIPPDFQYISSKELKGLVRESGILNDLEKRNAD